MKRALLATVLLLEFLTGCRLAEVSLPSGEDVLVVEGILRVGVRRQNILLHRSVDGRLVRGEPGASVIVSRETGPDLVFTEANLLECIVGNPLEWKVEDIEVEASCYTYLFNLGQTVLPGRTYELRVETEDGTVARGRTTVPGAFRLSDPAIPPWSLGSIWTCALPDTAFEAIWTRSGGAWSYLTSLRITNWGDELRAQGVEVPEVIELTGVSVSDADTTILFPTNLGLFQRAEYDQRVLLALQDGVPAEADATFALLALDRNYTNAIRGGRFNPSGNVRTSSVVGGAVGVFGSVVPILVRSPGASSEPRPGPC